MGAHTPCLQSQIFTSADILLTGTFLAGDFEVINRIMKVYNGCPKPYRSMPLT